MKTSPVHCKLFFYEQKNDFTEFDNRSPEKHLCEMIFKSGEQFLRKFSVSSSGNIYNASILVTDSQNLLVFNMITGQLDKEFNMTAGQLD